MHIVDDYNTYGTRRYVSRSTASKSQPAVFVSLVQVVNSCLFEPNVVVCDASRRMYEKKIIANVFKQELSLLVDGLAEIYQCDTVTLPSSSINDTLRGLTFKTRPSPTKGELHRYPFILPSNDIEGTGSQTKWLNYIERERFYGAVPVDLRSCDWGARRNYDRLLCLTFYSSVGRRTQSQRQFRFWFPSVDGACHEKGNSG